MSSGQSVMHHEVYCRAFFFFEEDFYCEPLNRCRPKGRLCLLKGTEQESLAILFFGSPFLAVLLYRTNAEHCLLFCRRGEQASRCNFYVSATHLALVTLYAIFIASALEPRNLTRGLFGLCLSDLCQSRCTKSFPGQNKLVPFETKKEPTYFSVN